MAGRFKSRKTGRYVSDYYGKRNPGRVIEVTGKTPPLSRAIRDARKRRPQLRLGQLLVNALPPEMDLFYVEDVVLAAYLDDFGRD